MHDLLRKPLSVYGLLAICLTLIIEPALPQYHFSPFWFSLGVVATVIALYDFIRKP